MDNTNLTKELSTQEGKRIRKSTILLAFLSILLTLLICLVMMIVVNGIAVYMSPCKTINECSYIFKTAIMSFLICFVVAPPFVFIGCYRLLRKIRDHHFRP